MSEIRVGLPKDLEDLPFTQLLEAYLLLTKEYPKTTVEFQTLILNCMANNGTVNVRGGWVDVLLYHPILREFALELMKRRAETFCQTSYYEWVILGTFLPIDDPFRSEVIRAMKGSENQF